MRLRELLFNGLGVGTLGVDIYLAIVDKSVSLTGRGGVLLGVAFICLCFGNLSRFVSFEANATGVAAVIRDDADRAEKAVAEIRLLAVAIGKVLITIITEGGRWQQEAARDMLKTKVIDQLEAAGLSADELREIETADAQWVEIMYVDRIFSRAKLNVEASLHSGFDNFKLQMGGWKRPNADEIEIFLKSHQALNDDTREWINDYRHYRETKTHRRPQIWANR